MLNKVKIVLASNNKDKLKEIREMLPDFEIVACRDAGFVGDVEENGNSFFENALIKAKTVSNALNLPALADDSGICVEALGGAPGIYSARYAGDGIDEHNNELLLENLNGKENRKAKYVCCMVYYKPDGSVESGVGEMYGEILTSPQGSNGFGYDPLFFSYDLNKPVGLASEREKNSVSHRFRALEKIKDKIK